MIGRYGPPIFQIFSGKAGAYNVALIKAIPKDELLKQYMYYFLCREDLLRYIESFGQRSAGQDGIDMDQLNAFWDQKIKKEAELRLHEQGAAPSPRAAKAAKDHQREYCQEKPRTVERKGPAPRPSGGVVAKAEPKEQRRPQSASKRAASGASSKKKMESVAEEDIWDSPAVGVGVRVAGIAALGALVALIVSIGSPVVTAVLNNRPT